MSTELEEVVDHVENALALLPQQFVGKENLAEFITAFVDLVQDAETMLQNLWTSRWLDNATGSQLDGLGAIVGQARENLGDDDYRARIKVRIRANYSSGLAVDIFDVFGLLLGDTTPPIILYEFFPAQLLLAVDEYIPGVDPEVMAALLKDIRATAVETQITFLSTAADDSFCFADGDDSENSGTQGFNGDDTWEDVTIGADAQLFVPQMIASNEDGSQVVAVGINGFVAHSLDGGLTWDSDVVGMGVAGWQCVVYADGVWVIGDDNGNIASLTDGDLAAANWTVVLTDPGGYAFNHIIWTGTKFVAGGNNGTVYYSSDGTTWTAGTFGSTKRIIKLAFNGSRLVAACAGPFAATRYSDDLGATWSAGSHPFSADIYDLIWSSALGLFVMAGFGSKVVATSVAGATFTGQTTPVSMAGNHGVALASTDAGLLAVGTLEGLLATSPDGTTWTEQTIGFSGAAVQSLPTDGTRIIAVGGGGNATLFDGSTWSHFADPICGGYDSVAIFTGESFMAGCYGSPTGLGSRFVSSDSGGEFADALEA